MAPSVLGAEVATGAAEDDHEFPSSAGAGAGEAGAGVAVGVVADAVCHILVSRHEPFPPHHCRSTREPSSAGVGAAKTEPAAKAQRDRVLMECMLAKFLGV